MGAVEEQPQVAEEAKDTAAVSLDMDVDAINASSEKTNIDIRVNNSVDMIPQIGLNRLEDNSELSVIVNKIPVDLWILVDSSALCRKRGIDSHVEKLITKLRADLHKDSLLSVISYMDRKLEIHASSKKITDLEDINIRCKNNAYSNNFGRALSHLLGNRKPGNKLPIHTWVYTSGNSRLSNQIMKAAKAAKVQMDLILFNRLVEKHMAFSVNKLKSRLGENKVTMQVFNPEVLYPSRWYRIELENPFTMQGKRVPLEVVVSSDGAGEAKKALTVEIPHSKESSYYEKLMKYLPWILSGIGLLFILWLLFKMRKAYRQRLCGKCGTPIRRADQSCLFCSSKQDGFLVGKFNHSDPLKKGKLDVAPMGKKITEIGTHKGSAVPLIGPFGKRKFCYVKIARKVNKDESASFLITRMEDAEGLEVLVNDKPLKGPRFLGVGDVLTVAGIELTFSIGGVK